MKLKQRIAAIKMKQLIAAILIVILLNSILFVVVAVVTEKPASFAPAHTDIGGVLINENKRVTLKDYCLLNWARGLGNIPRADGAIAQLAKSNYTRVGFVSEVFVQLLQNRINSIVLFLVDPLNDNKFSKEWRSAAQGTASWVTVIKLFGEYYIITQYTENGTIDDSIPAAVYRADDPKAIEPIESFRTKKEDYSGYSFYPLELADYVEGPFRTVFVVLLQLAEVYGVYCLLMRSKSKKRAV